VHVVDAFLDLLINPILVSRETRELMLGASIASKMNLRSILAVLTQRLFLGAGRGIGVAT
jgi:hypothetical protein